MNLSSLSSLAALHVLGYSFNFYHLVTQPTSLLCIFESIVFRAEFVPTFQWWLFGTLTGTGHNAACTHVTRTHEHPSNYPSIHLSILAIHLSINPSIQPHPPIHLSSQPAS